MTSLCVGVIIAYFLNLLAYHYDVYFIVMRLTLLNHPIIDSYVGCVLIKGIVIEIMRLFAMIDTRFVRYIGSSNDHHISASH